MYFSQLSNCNLALPLGQMPVLIVDGVMYCQTAAIVTYVAKLAGLSKLTDLEELTSSMIVESLSEIGDAVSKSAFAARSAVDG